ncbi:MAG: hypothetical protein C0417_08200 [Chlorobiaceae bacterium]|nr:hypothetical protein [Chlorobiaceae bacterium]
MSQQELLKKIVRFLEENKIEYMLTGSYISSLQGEPRSTNDIDIVIALEKNDIARFLYSFPKDNFYFEEQNIKEAIEQQTMFNVIDLREGDKIDFWIITNDPFDQSRFSRKISEEIFGTRICISTPEDTILMKLKWANLSGGSEKQFTDALSVYEIQYEKLDMQYINYWIDKLQLQDLWNRIQQEALLP